jgi:hypothetical protein
MSQIETQKPPKNAMIAEKFSLHNEIDRFDFLFAAIQKLQQNAVDALDEHTRQIADLYDKLSVFQSVTKQELYKIHPMIDRTFYRRLKSGDIKEVLQGRYAISKALYDKIPRFVDGIEFKPTKASTGSNKSVSHTYPSYVFTTPIYVEKSEVKNPGSEV